MQVNDVNLWPPFSVTLTPINNTQTGVTSTPSTTGNFATGMFPVYYIPTQQRTLQSDPALATGFQGKFSYVKCCPLIYCEIKFLGLLHYTTSINDLYDEGFRVLTVLIYVLQHKSEGFRL